MKEAPLSDFVQRVIDAVPEGMLFCDTDYRIRFVNKYYARLLGAEPSELYGQNLIEQNPKTRAPIVIKQGDAEMWDMCSFPKSGEARRFIVNRIPVKGPEGEITGMVSHVVFSDPSELKALNDKISALSTKLKFYKNSIKSFLKQNYDIERIIGNSPAMLEVKRLIRGYADKIYPVLIMGQTGTGKELVAHALHSESSHADGPFISINCAAIPKELFESELFGYAPGAFSGAQRDGKAGQIELADNGTLFLDEIGDLPLHVQVKLHRVLEDKRITRVGSIEETKVNFRLVTATNRDLEGMVARGTFREDLFYRINTLNIKLPPLSERTEDIMPIVHNILSRIGSPNVEFTQEAERVLEAYAWPGNIRQLYNTVVHATIHTTTGTVDVSDLPSEVVDKSGVYAGVKPLPRDSSLEEYMDLREEEFLRHIIKEKQGNITASAKALGISRMTLYGKLKKYGIECGSEPEEEDHPAKHSRAGTAKKH